MKKPIKYKITEKGCWEETNHSKDRDGYSYITRRGKIIGIHRYMYKKYIGPIPDKMFVCHHCDNPSCINPSHLFLGTTQDNTRDRNNKNRQAKGIKIGRSKLTPEKVIDLRNKYIPGRHGNMRELCKEFNISSSMFYVIIHNKCWKYL